jgi:hypothetical protein
MIKLLLYLLDRIPYRTKFGLSIADELKVLYYQKIGQFKEPEICLCGGRVVTTGIGQDGWETICYSCEFLYDED